MLVDPNAARRGDVVPDGLPALGRGRHRHPRGAVCLMEYVSLLAGEPSHTDRPSCSHPQLTDVAHAVNDLTSSDASRAGLVRLAPDLVGTHVNDPRAAPLVVLVCLRAAASAGAGGPEFDDAVWQARTRLAAESAPRDGGESDPRRRGDARAAYRAVERGWREVRRWDAEDRDRWLAGLLRDATEAVRALARDHPDVRPVPRWHAVTHAGG